MGGDFTNMCFCETNPPFFGLILCATGWTQAGCRGKVVEISVGSFWKTNPPERGFRGGLGYSEAFLSAGNGLQRAGRSPYNSETARRRSAVVTGKASAVIDRRYSIGIWVAIWFH